MLPFLKRFLKKAHGQDLTREFIDGLCDKLVTVPHGSFLMGSNDGEDDERPIHNVLIDSFYLSRYPVTQKEWFHVMGTKPWEELKFIKTGDNFPAVNICWYDAKDFIEALNEVGEKQFRFPTEAEWEYACRAGAASAFAHGVLKFNLSKYAWYYDNAFKKGEMYAHEIGQMRANRFGLYDMQGNVYEWCLDWYRRNYYNKSPIHNPQGPIYGNYKAVRGGDWARTDYFLRVASRRHYSPHYKDSFVGFRLAMDAATASNGKTTGEDMEAAYV